ncbi:TPA: hypothetical protein ACGO9T_001783, partial [Streptococcus suis]
HGPSVTHELPAGHFSVHGSSLMHELPAGHLSVRGTSLTHELPSGHLSLHGSSVTHELPKGHLSVHGSSVTHELPVGHLSVHGSSLTHELPKGDLPISENTLVIKSENVTAAKIVVDQAGQEIVSNIIRLSNQYSGKVYIRQNSKIDGADEQANSSRGSVSIQGAVEQTDVLSSQSSIPQSVERKLDLEKNQGSNSSGVTSNSQEQDEMEQAVLDRESELDSRDKEVAAPTPYLVALSILGIGFISYWLLVHKMIIVDKK